MSIIIRMDLQEVGNGGMDWIRLAQDRDRWLALVNAVMNLLVP
jgi:CRISPR/Cas system-associated protein Cas7 (RAMP superfamily)